MGPETWPATIRRYQARDVLSSGWEVDARQALPMGIADRIASADAPVAETQRWAAEPTQGPRPAIARSKVLLSRNFKSTAGDISAQGSVAQGIRYTADEHRNVVWAFLHSVAKKPGAGKS
jgi:enoyl-CoA hydratase/carnithine racemase